MGYVGYLVGYVVSHFTDRKKPVPPSIRRSLDRQIKYLSQPDLALGGLPFNAEILGNVLDGHENRGCDIDYWRTQLYELTHKPLPETATQDLDNMLTAVGNPRTSIEPSSFTTEMTQERLTTYHQQGFDVRQYQTRLDKITASIIAAKESELEKAANSIDLTLPPNATENVNGPQ